MDHRHVADLGEGEAVQLAGGPVHGLAHLLQLQVRFHLVLVEVVFGQAHFLKVVAVVPRLDGDPGALGVGDLLHHRHFLMHAGHGRLPDAQHQVHRLVRGAGHLVGRDPVGVGRVAEQAGALGAQLEDLGDDGVVVVRVAVVAAHDPHPPALLAQGAIAGIGDERLHRGAGVGDQPLALEALFLGRAGGVGLDRLGQAGQVVRAELEGVAFLVGQLVLAEGGVERRQPLGVASRWLISPSRFFLSPSSAAPWRAKF